MDQNNEQQSNPHFPEDRDAPVIESKSRVKDYIVLGFISILTLVTVSFSIYIIIVKYF